jgi:hypothetical protein
VLITLVCASLSILDKYVRAFVLLFKGAYDVDGVLAGIAGLWWRVNPKSQSQTQAFLLQELRNTSAHRDLECQIEPISSIA